MIPPSHADGRSRRPTATGTLPAEPFRSAEQAWFWTMRSLQARRDGARSSGRSVPRPCDPDDVVRCLDQLYRVGRIDLAHGRALRRWGERQEVPGGGSAPAGADVQLWREAMDRLDWPLRAKGIVG